MASLSKRSFLRCSEHSALIECPAVDEKPGCDASENPLNTAISGQDPEASPEHGSQPPSTTRSYRRGPRRYLPEAITVPGPPGDTSSGGGADSSESAPISARWDASRLPLVEPSNYARTEEAGQGGIGLVWKGQDLRLGRTVALKELRESGRSARERFLREALVTARLQHPSIVPVYEAGRWPTGEPFYAMKHVSGDSLDSIIEKSKTMGQRLALLPHVLAVAEAVAYAHSERILHRDLKPSNVLLGSFGETMVIDWGLAKDLNEAERAEKPLAEQPTPSASPEQKHSGLTLAGSVMGTPAYMPPEQALGLAVDERADVYALGAILYHVLSGAPPYTGANSKEILKKVLEGPPPPISKRMEGVPPDLAALVHTAMARDPAKRYPSAKEFAEDLKRYQTGQIVGAHTYSWLERIVRFIKRNKTAVLIAAISALSIAIVSGLSLQELIKARKRAEAERDRAAEKQAEAEQAQKNAQMHADDLALARAHELAPTNPNQALFLLSALSPWFNNWGAARTIASNARSWGISKEFDHGASVNNVLFLSKSNALLTACDDRLIRIIDLKTRSVRALRGHTDEVYWLYLSPDEKRLITTGKDKRVLLWDIDTGNHRELADQIMHIGVSSNFLYLTMLGRNNLRVIEIDSGKTLVSASWTPSGLIPPFTGDTSFSADGRYVVLVQATGLAMWELPSGKALSAPALKIKNPETEALQAVSAVAHGIAATARMDGQILLWNSADKKSKWLKGHTEKIDFLSFTSDGRTLVSTSRDETIRFWDIKTGTSTVAPGHKGKVFSWTFSPDGQWVASGGIDKTIRIFSTSGRENWTLRGMSGAVHGVSFSSDGQSFAAASGDHWARVWDLSSIGSRILSAHDGSLEFVRPSADKRFVTFVASDGHVHRLDIDEALKRAINPAEEHKAAAKLPSNWLTGHPIDMSPDGQTVAAKLPNASLAVLHVADGKLKQLKGNSDVFTFFIFGKDNRTLYSLSDDRRALRWDVETGEVTEIATFDQKCVYMALSPDGTRMAFGLEDGLIQWKETNSDKNTIKLTGHTNIITALQFSPDGKAMLSGSRDHALYLWDLTTGQSKKAYLALPAEAFVFLPGHSFVARVPASSIRVFEESADGFKDTAHSLHTGGVTSMALSGDGRQLATASEDHTVRLVDLPSFQTRPLIGHSKKVQRVFYTADNAGVISAGADGTVRFWKDDLPAEPGALRRWIEQAAAERYSVEQVR